MRTLTVASTSSSERARSSPQVGTQLRVLIIEDNPDIADTTARLLSFYGYVVETARDGLLGMEKVHSFRPDAILLDIGLPGLDGYQVARLIHDDPGLGPVTIIACSAYGPEADPDRTRSAEFDYHLVKPVLFDDLLAVLRSRG